MSRDSLNLEVGDVVSAPPFKFTYYILDVTNTSYQIILFNFQTSNPVLACVTKDFFDGKYMVLAKNE